MNFIRVTEYLLIFMILNIKHFDYLIIFKHKHLLLKWKLNKKFYEVLT